MSSRRVPNVELKRLLLQSGWTGQALADAVNRLGAENGIPLHYDRTSVAHWLAGTRPSSRVAGLVAEAFSRQLVRPVGPEDTGLIRPEPERRTRGMPTAQELMGQLVWLGAPEVRRRDLLRGVTYSLASMSFPALGDIAAGAPPPDDRERIGPAHVEAATLMVSVFSATDMAFGGGAGRSALSAYLANDVAPWLRAAASPSTRAALCAVAARLCYLAGWMCFDDSLHGAGQRYYRHAASLAAEAGDACCYAAVLRSLSVQAHYLGHHRAALDFADNAMRQSRRVPRMEAAFLAGQLSVANAACGDARAALDHLRTAERLLHRAEAADAHVGGYDIAALAHQQAETLAAIGDRPGAVRALGLSLRHRRPGERRARAITSARLAELHLAGGYLDRACGAWSTLLDDRPHLASGRVHQAVQSMRARLRAHARYAPAQRLLTRASLAAEAAPPSMG